MSSQESEKLAPPSIYLETLIMEQTLLKAKENALLRLKTFFKEYKSDVESGDFNLVWRSIKETQISDTSEIVGALCISRTDMEDWDKNDQNHLPRAEYRSFLLLGVIMVVLKKAEELISKNKEKISQLHEAAKSNAESA